MLGLSQFRLRPILVIGEFLLIAALAFIGSQRQLALVLFLPVGVGLVLTCLRWPPLGIIVASVAGMFIPFSGPSGLNVTMILVALLLGLWLLDVLVRKPQIQLATSRTMWPLLAFLVVSAISFGVGQLPWFSFAPHAPLGAQLGGLSIIVLSAGTFLLVASQVREMRWLSTITWAFLAFAALSLIGRSVLPRVGLSIREIFQPVGSIFYLWLVSMSLSQAVFNRDLHPRWRWALGGLVLLTLYLTFYLKFADKSGWIPSLLATALIIGFRYKRAWLVMFRLESMRFATDKALQATRTGFFDPEKGIH